MRKASCPAKEGFIYIFWMNASSVYSSPTHTASKGMFTAFYSPVQLDYLWEWRSPLFKYLGELNECKRATDLYENVLKRENRRRLFGQKFVAGLTDKDLVGRFLAQKRTWRIKLVKHSPSRSLAHWQKDPEKESSGCLRKNLVWPRKNVPIFGDTYVQWWSSKYLENVKSRFSKSLIRFFDNDWWCSILFFNKVFDKRGYRKIESPDF
jgi:hypothetical protein